MSKLREIHRRYLGVWLVGLSVLLLASVCLAQETGKVTGTVKNADSGEPLKRTNVSVKGTMMGAATDSQGRYTITGVPSGTHTLVFSAIGYTDVEARVTVTAGETTTQDAELAIEVIELGDVTVYGASKHPERITQAPSAISAISPLELRQMASTGQVPRLFDAQPGVDLAQNGVNDFNLNTRGFNSSLTRRVLVLMDNRELVVALLGSQEWNALSRPLEDFGRLEIIRGPGSALYGANAFAGVINITTPAPKEIVGTKISASGGELNSFRGDIRHAGVSGAWSYKVNFGYTQGESWDESRNVTQEYEGLPGERFPLNDDDLRSIYGAARLDYDLASGGVFTVEGGMAQAENQVIVTGIGRVQIDKVRRPWARTAFASDRFFLQADYRGRKTFDDHQVSPVSGAVFEEDDWDFDFQGQTNFTGLEDKLRVIVGASHRFRHVNTDNTILSQKFDETFSGVFGQFEYKISDKINLVGAARVDASSIHDTQFSPKGAIVFSPTEDHSFRATVNRAFQTPSTTEFFLRVPAGVPIDLAPLEAGIEAAIEQAQGLPPGTVDLPLNFGVTPVLALGNEKLEVEEVTSFELGYKGVVSKKAFVTVDAYFSQLENFITDLLPRVNPAFPAYQVPEGIDPALVPIINGAIQNALGPAFPLFSTLPDGSKALVVSYGNAGEVDVMGIELGLNYYLTDDLLFTGNYSFFEFDVDDKTVAIGDNLIPNTPKHKFNLGLSYQGRQGLDASVQVKYVDGFDWAAGVFVGDVPSYTLVNFSGGYKVTSNARLGLVITNLLDNDHYELFGGSLNGRRALGSLTYEF